MLLRVKGYCLIFLRLQGWGNIRNKSMVYVLGCSGKTECVHAQKSECQRQNARNSKQPVGMVTHKRVAITELWALSCVHRGVRSSKRCW